MYSIGGVVIVEIEKIILIWIDSFLKKLNVYVYVYVYIYNRMCV